MTNSTYVLQGGFWGGAIGVQTPGAPWLTVTRSNAAVLISWPAASVGWRLHFSTDLVITNVWAEIPPPYPTDGNDCVVTEPAQMGKKFYRLQKP